MKKSYLLTVILVIALVFGMTVVGCDIEDNPDNGNGDGNGNGNETGKPDGVFTSIADMAAWLNSKSTNTVSTPYYIKLNVSDLGGSYNTSGSAGNTLYTNRSNKYVRLDLSGSTITSIGIGAFAYCTNLTNVTIPDSVEGIGGGAFAYCAGFTSVNIPNSVTSIGEEAFEFCTGLTSITIPNSVISIGWSAFYNTSLIGVTIPNNVTSIGQGAFTITSLTAINVDSGNSAYTAENGILYNKNKTVLHTYPAGKTGNSFSIPNSVTSIGYGAFYSCTNLTSVTIPNSVTSIENYAFATDSLVSVKFEGTIDLDNFHFGSFQGDLRAKYLAGGIGTYTRPNGSSKTWTKQ